MTESQSAPQKLIQPELWVLIVLGLCGIVFFFWKFQESFPSASINLQVGRSQATKLSRDWLPKIGYDAKNTIESTVFSYDEDASVFLEYEFGQARANELMRSEIPIWYWQSRFCRPFDQEEASVGIGPDGSVHFLSHSLPNDAPAPTISHDQALALARQFAETQMHQPVASQALVKDAEDKQVKRTDYYFTWEDRSHDYKGAYLRTYVGVSGDKVTDYMRFLHVPEKFNRKYADIRSYNELLKQIATIIYTALACAIPFVFFWALTSGRMRWKFAFFAGGIGAVLYILNYIDGLPSLIAGYQTTMSFQQYITDSAIHAALGIIAKVLMVVLFIGTLEPIYRITFPEKIALEKLATSVGARSADVFRSVVAGLATFGVHTAYVVAFYLAGQRLGMFSPLEVRESSTLSGLFPFFSAIDIGVSASTTEELMYRVLCLALFKRITGNFWVANLLQAASWAFMHSDYPQEPAYARGLELTIGGFFYGYILRRYGLPACILAHYTYDAFLGVTPLITSHSPGDRLSSLIAVAPGIIALIACGWSIYSKGRTPESEVADIRNEAIQPTKKPTDSQPEVTGVPPFHYRPLSQQVLVYSVIAGLLGTLILCLTPLRTAGGHNVLQVSRAGAIAIARQYLQKRGAPINKSKVVAALGDETDDTQMQYILEKEGFSKVAQLAKSLEPRLLWKVRFFKPHDPEEFYVSVTPDGKIYSTTDIEDEDAAGDKPDQAQAQAQVEHFLDTEHPDLKPHVLDDTTKHEHKNRTDFDFTYHIPQLKAAEADFKVSTGTTGSQVSGLTLSWQIPSSWTFERNRVHIKDQVFDVLRSVFAVAVLLFSFWWLISVLRHGRVRFRLPAIIAGITAVLLVVRQLNSLPVLYWSYPVDINVQTFLTQRLVNDLLIVLSGSAGTGLLVAVALAAYELHFPEQPWTSIVIASLPHMGKVSATTRRIWLDATVLSIFYCLAAASVDHIVAYFHYLITPTVRLFPVGDMVTITDQWSPALGSVVSAISAGITAVFVSAVIGSMVRFFFRGSVLRLAAFWVVATLVMQTSLRYWQDYVLGSIGVFVIAGFAFFFFTRFARFNALAYFLVGYYSMLGSSFLSILRHEDFGLCYPELAMLAIAILAPAVYTGWLYLAPKQEVIIAPAE